MADPNFSWRSVLQLPGAPLPTSSLTSRAQPSSSSTYPLYTGPHNDYTHNGGGLMPLRAAEEQEIAEFSSHDASSSMSPSEVESPVSPPSHLKKLRLLVPNPRKAVQEDIDTPATRLKTRPKRANAFTGQTGRFSESDSDDEDYVAPRSASSLSTKKNREKMRSNPLEFSSRLPDSIYKYPTNAFPALAYSSWPKLTNLAYLDEDGVEIEEPARELPTKPLETSQPSTSFLPPSNSSSISTSAASQMILDRMYPPTTTTSSTQSETSPSGAKEVIISVPEYEEYLEHCDPESFVSDLNYPESIPIAGLSSWSSTLERKMRKEGSALLDLPTPNWDDVKWEQGTYINCDLRYYDLSPLGKFDVVLLDPPWRIRGAQNVSDEKTIFNNNKFTLQYNTMSNEEIMDLDVGQLSDRGFIFLWTINSQLQTAFECLNRWGYTFVDRITWIKKTNKDSIFIGQGYYLLHSSEICVIGAKKDMEGNYLEVVQKVSNDLIFSPTQKKSQKPDQMYHIIERMFPGARKVELFARNHNIRPGWLSIGNQLGPHYNWSHDDITCDECHLKIQLGQMRYKHKHMANRDLCKSCLTKLFEPLHDYYALNNRFDEQCFHEYYECNGCQAKPLWGIRFTCQQCPDFDLCEACHDGRVVPEELAAIHKKGHTFAAIETPELAGGLSVHRHRCLGCNTFPIVGCRFKCVECSGNMSLCQKCFFAKKTPRSHLPSHEIQLITEPLLAHAQVKCDICGVKPIIGPRFKCEQCFNFDICQACHDSQRPPPINYASHKPTHTYHRILGDVDLPTKEYKGGDKGWGPADVEE